LRLVTVAVDLPGDHNGDGAVDAADYVAWRKDPDSFGGDPDGYDDWRESFGSSGPGDGGQDFGASVPEPATMLLVVWAIGGLAVVRSRTKASAAKSCKC
jgi:hypothetical protein